MNPKSVKITGPLGQSPTDWSITDAKTGESIQWVRRVEFVLDGEHGARAIIYVDGPGVDVEMPAVIAPEQRAQEQRIAEAVIEALAGKQERLAGLYARADRGRLEYIVRQIVEEQLGGLITEAIRSLAEPKGAP